MLPVVIEFFNLLSSQKNEGPVKLFQICCEDAEWGIVHILKARVDYDSNLLQRKVADCEKFEESTIFRNSTHTACELV